MNTISTSRLRAGDWVQVRTKEEILGTLDARGRLDELPFMPEMLAYCGKRMRVGKRAHKTCDPAVGIGGRKMANTVHLENIRCNGSAHDGCEAACLIFWKEAWLKPIDGSAPPNAACAPCRRASGRSNAPRIRFTPCCKIPPSDRRDRADLCVPEHADQVRNATAAMVGHSPVRRGLHLGQRPLSQLAAGLLYSSGAPLPKPGSASDRRCAGSMTGSSVRGGDTPYPMRPYGVPRGTRGAASATRSAARRAGSRQAVCRKS